MAESIHGGRWSITSWDRKTGKDVKISADLIMEINKFQVFKTLSARALRNKTGKATALGGAIVVKVSNRSQCEVTDGPHGTTETPNA